MEASDTQQAMDLIGKGSYMDALGGGKAPAKASYSPFNSKPIAAASNGFMYSPPSSSSTASTPETSFSEEVYDDEPNGASPTGASYLERISPLRMNDAPAKASYSPFGSKPQGSRSSGGGYLGGL